MAYFNHAFQKTFYGGGATGYVNNAGDNSVDLLGLYGPGAFTFADQAATGWPSVAVAPATGAPLTLVATSLYQNDKIGPFAGGYHETTKSKMVNPRFINRFYKVEAKLPVSNIIGVGATPNLDLSGADAGCCPTFYCNENYHIRFDLKGSPTLRMLNHNAYEVAAAYTGCCAGPTPEVVDPFDVMSAWATYVNNDPIFTGVYGQWDQRLVNVGVVVTCDSGTTWEMYLPDNAETGIAGLYFEADGTTPTAAAVAFENAVSSSVGGVTVAFDNTTLVPGTGYTGAVGVATTSSGSGVGLTVDTTDDGGGGIATVAINAAGTGYAVGDVVTIAGGGTNATIVISDVDAFSAAVAPIGSYVSTFTPATPNCCAGLVMQAAFVETEFADCTFQPTDHFELEPLKIQASMMDETGDPCVFEQLCISDGITPSGAGSTTVYPAMQTAVQTMGTGEGVLRDLILSESYDQNFFNTNDAGLRIREITQGTDVLAAVNRNTLYTCYYILHTVPRSNNPTGVFDNDQYLLKIPLLDAAATGVGSATFEAFMAAWLTAAGSTVTLETL
jgi:hypothetical protein